MDLIDIQDVGSESRILVEGRDVVSVYAAAIEDATWTGGVMAAEVSVDGNTWFDARTCAGYATPTLSADGGIQTVYTGDIRWARLVVTTAASSPTMVEVRWP